MLLSKPLQPDPSVLSVAESVARTSVSAVIKDRKTDIIVAVQRHRRNQLTTGAW